jgi:hypothetical protein
MCAHCDEYSAPSDLVRDFARSIEAKIRAADREARPAPATSVVPEHVEQAAFEKWLRTECPSGDCESVSRQWEASHECRELHEAASEARATGDAAGDAAPWPVVHAYGGSHGTNRWLDVRLGAGPETTRYVLSDRATGEAAPTWRCFHCDEAFTDRDQAALHFGTSEHDRAICTIDPEHFRWVEAQHRRNVDDDSDALRTVRTLANEHETLRKRAEEEGYARGLADAKKHPEELGLAALSDRSTGAVPCPHCDDTGDVTSIVGEWRGYCACPAGVAVSATAAPPVAPAAYVEAWLCKAWGETDIPAATFAMKRDDLRAFIVREWLGDEDALDGDDEPSLPRVMDDLDSHDWSEPWDAEFEIGGLKIERVSAWVAAIGAAGEPQPREGWKWVPVEPTDAMTRAGFNCVDYGTTVESDIERAWSVMLAAVPQADSGAAGERCPQCPHPSACTVHDECLKRSAGGQGDSNA